MGRDGPTEQAPARPFSVWAAPLVGLCLVVQSWYLIEGAGFVLDDWYFLRNATLDGALHVAGPSGGDRPVGAAVWAVLFGGIGSHPAPILLLMGLGNGIAAVLLWRLLSRFFPARLALATAVIWIILPTHTSLEAYMSASIVVLAQAAVLGALLLLSVERPSPRRLVGAALLSLLAVLSYESASVLALAGTLLVRWAGHRRLDLAPLASVGAAVGAGLLWATTHWRGRSPKGSLANPLLVLPANFGWGIAPSEDLASLALSVVLVGAVMVGWHATRNRAHSAHPGSIALGIGLVVLVAGTAPFVTYIYEPLGAGDRLNWISALGAALMLAGLLEHLWARSWRRALVATCALALIALPTRAERTDLWTTAGADGQRVAHALVAAHPHLSVPVLVGPEPIVRGNIAAFAASSNVRAAVQLAYGSKAVTARLSRSATEFGRAQNVIRFDQRPFIELDERH